MSAGTARKFLAVGCRGLLACSACDGHTSAGNSLEGNSCNSGRDKMPVPIGSDWVFKGSAGA